MNDQKTEIVSFRLNPRDEHEGRALKILKQKKAQGFYYRQTVTHAILECAGDKPEMYRERGETLNASIIESIIESTVGALLEDFASHIIDTVLEDVKHGRIVPEADNPFEGNDETPDRTSYEVRLAASIQQRRKQKRGG